MDSFVFDVYKISVGLHRIVQDSRRLLRAICDVYRLMHTNLRRPEPSRQHFGHLVNWQIRRAGTTDGKCGSNPFKSAKRLRFLQPFIRQQDSNRIWTQTNRLMPPCRREVAMHSLARWLNRSSRPWPRFPQMIPSAKPVTRLARSKSLSPDRTSNGE